jgi:hypothetical protein
LSFPRNASNYPSSPKPQSQSLPSPQTTTIMAEIKIDKTLFQERLSHFMSAWKADKRGCDLWGCELHCHFDGQD